MRTVRYKFDPNLETDDRIDIYATDGNGGIGSLIQTVYSTGTSNSLGSWAADIQVVN